MSTPVYPYPGATMPYQSQYNQTQTPSSSSSSLPILRVKQEGSYFPLTGTSATTSASPATATPQYGARTPYTPATATPYTPATALPVNLQQYASYFQQSGMTIPGYSFGAQPGSGMRMVKGDEEDEELYPGMDDADYSAQLQYQSQSKADLKVLLDHFTAEQHARFEAYRRSTLNKGSIRKVITQTTGQQVSQPVAQVVAGLGKVFVGEIVEKARKIQQRRGETGPLTPDHLRAAYKMYQDEYGWVGPAKPLRAKKLFLDEAEVDEGGVRPVHIWYRLLGIQLLPSLRDVYHADGECCVGLPVCQTDPTRSQLQTLPR